MRSGLPCVCVSIRSAHRSNSFAPHESCPISANRFPFFEGKDAYRMRKKAVSNWNCLRILVSDSFRIHSRDESDERAGRFRDSSKSRPSAACMPQRALRQFPLIRYNRRRRRMRCLRRGGRRGGWRRHRANPLFERIALVAIHIHQL